MNHPNCYNPQTPCEHDYNGTPLVIDLRNCTRENPFFRFALWTGEFLQVTMMCIPPYSDIGLEKHPHLDQFLYVESGNASICMGRDKNTLSYRKKACPGTAILIPAGTWHNLINTGQAPVHLFSIYTPPQHPRGTKQAVKPEED